VTAETSTDTAARLFPRPRQVTPDILAGLTVALVGLPQCLAYAMMSGLPPAYGLVTAAIPGFVAALAGESARVITGPTNTTGLLILATLTPFLGANGLLGEDALGALALLTLMAGVFRVTVAALGGDKVLRFLPDSVLIGFTAGAGILIAVMQLDEALGLPASRGAGTLSQIQEVFSALVSVGPTTGALITTGLTVVAILLGKKYAPNAPVALLSVAGAMFIAWAAGLDAASGLPLVRDRAALPQGWPPVGFPSMDPELMRQFALPAAAITLLGTLELTVSAKADPAKPSMRREIFGQGMANIAGAFVGAFPASASLTRSALLRLGNAQTKLAPVVAALVLIPILLFLTPAVGYIPQASLAGVLWVTAVSMVKPSRLVKIWRLGWAPRLLLMSTLISTLFLPLEIAIFVGVGTALLVHLAQDSEARYTLLVPTEDGLALFEDHPTSSTVIVEISGNMHFAAAHHFSEEIHDVLPHGPTRVILDLSHAHRMRYAAILAFEDLRRELGERDATLELAGVDEGFFAMLQEAESDLLCSVADPLPGVSLKRVLEEE